MSQAPEVAKNLSRVRSWIENSGLANTAIASQAGVDEKLVRLIKKGDGNPTVATLQKLEGLIPADWQPDPPPPEQPGERAT